MSELILLGVIIVLSLLLFWEKRQNALERQKLINAVVAKNAGEQVMLDTSDKVKPEPPQPPDLVPTDNLTDEEFSKYIGVNE